MNATVLTPTRAKLRPYVHVTRDPDLFPWTSAQTTAVTVAESLAAGARVSFWIRPAVPGTAIASLLGLTINVNGDEVIPPLTALV